MKIITYSIKNFFHRSAIFPLIVIPGVGNQRGTRVVVRNRPHSDFQSWLLFPVLVMPAAFPGIAPQSGHT